MKVLITGYDYGAGGAQVHVGTKAGVAHIEVPVDKKLTKTALKIIIAEGLSKLSVYADRLSIIEELKGTELEIRGVRNDRESTNTDR